MASSFLSLAELRKKTPAELRLELTKLYTQQLNARCQSATGQLSDTSQLAKLRRQIARCLTVLRHA